MRSVSSLETFLECSNHSNENPNACKAYMKFPNYITCDKFCANLGYACYEAYKEKAEDQKCEVRTEHTVDCSGPENNDFVCGCEKGISYSIILKTSIFLFCLYKTYLFYKNIFIL